MSHPMKDARQFPVALDQPYGAVMVERKSLREKTVVVQPGIHAIKASTPMLPFDGTVLDQDGKEIRPERGSFWITAETLDPFHLLCDGLPGRS